MVLESYSTAATAPPERAAHWSAIIADTYFPLQLSYRDPATFQGRLERRSAGPVSLSRLRTEPACYERVPGLIRHGEAEEYLVTIPSAAPVLFRQLGRDVTCGPGGFLLERGDAPYRFAYEARNDLLVMKIAHRALSERLRQPDRLCATIFDGRQGLCGLFAETVRRAHAMPEDAGAAEVLGRHLIELLALALDRQAETDSGAGTAIRAAHLQRAQQAIRREIRDPALSPEGVARACGISKRYLHDLFSETGTTVAQHIRETRLQAARDMLQMPGDLSLAGIAYRLGFCDQAQFSRQFRAFFGQTPRDYRKACRERQGLG
ncbi:AraC-like ligand-binding domain-containing protein [Paracoccus binzhouensis]|uniref:AraC-like ligand-binding domain-containing protein n=1 Tax=Paracoccus binzhouensis TaxID=2796149 RepID=UPI0018EF1A62|nr:helix-turn-helix domain-containing protein [Paracoccus binzhouensis]